MTNKNKKNFFKSFLATTSAFAVITGASNSAMGAQYTTNDGGIPRIADGLVTRHSDAKTRHSDAKTRHSDAKTRHSDAKWVAGDSFFWSHARDLRLGTKAKVATVATLDLNNQADRTITVSNKDSSVASLVDSSGNNQTAALVVKDGSTLTLGENATGVLADGVTAQAAGDFSGLGDVTLGSGGSELTINSNATFGGTIDSGVININAGKQVVFNGVIGGGQVIDEINLVGVGSIVIFNEDVKATTVLTKDATAEIQVVNKTITGNVDSDGNGGILQFTVGAGGVTGTIGAAKALTAVQFNAGGNAIALGGNAEATDFTFAAADDVTAAGTITGNVDFAQNAGRLQAGGLITGNVDNTGGNAVAGTLKFTAAGGVTGVIGATKALTAVQFNAGGNAIALGGNAEATDFTFAAADDVTAGGTITGNVDFAQNAATLTAAGLITGNVDNTGGNAVAGTLKFTAAGGVTGVIGATKALTAVQFNAGGNAIALGGNAEATDFTFGAADDVTAAGTITGNVDFAQNAATLTAAGLITGNVDNTGGNAVAGTLNLAADGGVTGAIGATKGLVVVNANGAGVVNLGNAIDTAALNVKSGTTVQAADNSAAAIAAINIGEVGGAGTLEIDAKGGNYDLLNATAITFAHADSKLKLTNTTNAGNSKVTLRGNLVPGGGVDLVGSLEINSAGTKTLNVAVNVAETIGTDNTHRLNEVIVSGDQDTTIAPNIFAKTITISSTADVTFGGAINSGANSVINFAGGGTVEFTAANAIVAGPSLNFTANTEVVTDGYDLAATNITNANNIIGSKLTVKVAQAITGNVGTLAQPFGTLHMDNAAATNVSINTAGFFAGVTGNANVSFDHAGGTVNFLGSGANSIKNANFVQDGRVFGEVHADTIDVQAGRTATFNGTVFEGVGVNNSMTMHANDAQADFTARVVLNMPILANAAGNGVINFNGGVDLRQAIGIAAARVARVDIGGDSTINANIYSGVINVGNHEVTLANDKTFDGVTTFTGTTITLGGNDLTMTGGNVTFTGESTIKTTVNGNNLGNLVASGAGSNIELTAGNANKIKVEVTETALAPDGTTIVLIRKDAGGTLNLDINRITVTKAGIFSSWEDTVTDEGLILTQNLQVEKETNRIAQEQGTSDVVTTAFASAFEKAEPGTQGFDVLSQVSLITEEEKLNDAQARIANTTANEVSAVNLNTINVVTDTISARIADVTSFVSPIVSTPVISSSVSTSPATAPTTGRGTSPVKTGVGKNIKVNSENNYISGIASGDDHTRFGAWATPFYSKSTQKKRSGTSGFKADSYGGTFGVDTKANDNMVIGLAFSAMNTDIKHKDFKSGDKTKVTSFLVSAYATHQFTNNWFGQGVFSMGSSSVNNKENRRISNTQLAIAEGKYNSMMFAAEVLGGYNHALNNQFVVTPMFGLNYNRINDGGYTESGSNAGPQLMEVTKRAPQKLDVVGGIRLTAMPFMANGVEITPEAHAFVRHDVIGKGAKVNAKIPGLNLPSEKAKLQKTFYNVGASLNAAYGAMDYGVSADANFANKYVGVQGSVKVRVNF